MGLNNEYELHKIMSGAFDKHRIKCLQTRLIDLLGRTIVLPEVDKLSDVDKIILRNYYAVSSLMNDDEIDPIPIISEDLQKNVDNLASKIHTTRLDEFHRGYNVSNPFTSHEQIICKLYASHQLKYITIHR